MDGTESIDDRDDCTPVSAALVLATCIVRISSAIDWEEVSVSRNVRQQH